MVDCRFHRRLVVVYLLPIVVHPAARLNQNGASCETGSRFLALLSFFGETLTWSAPRWLSRAATSGEPAVARDLHRVAGPRCETGWSGNTGYHCSTAVPLRAVPRRANASLERVRFRFALALREVD